MQNINVLALFLFFEKCFFSYKFQWVMKFSEKSWYLTMTQNSKNMNTFLHNSMNIGNLRGGGTN